MPRPQLTTDEVDATRKRLTTLALALYLKEGLDTVSFRRLAEAAEISHTLPYRYFANKEDLLVALRVECTEHFERFVRSHEHPSDSPLARIRQIADGVLGFVQTHHAEYQLIFSTHQPSPDRYPALLAARRSFFDHAVVTVQEAIDAGQMQGEARALTHLFWVSLHGLVTLHVAGQLVHGCTMQELVEPLITQMLSGSLPVPPRNT